MSNLQSFKIWFPKSWLKYRRQVVNSRHQSPQGQSLQSLELNSKNPKWEYNFDLKGPDNMLNPSF